MSKSTSFSAWPAETTSDVSGPALGSIEHPPKDRAIEQARQAARFMSIEPKIRHLFISSQKPPITALQTREPVPVSNRARSAVSESLTSNRSPSEGRTAAVGNLGGAWQFAPTLRP